MIIGVIKGFEKRNKRDRKKKLYMKGFIDGVESCEETLEKVCSPELLDQMRKAIITANLKD